MIIPKGSHLFHGDPILALLSQVETKLNHEIDTVSTDSLLRVSIDDRAEELAGRYKLDVPVLSRDNIYQDAPKEVQVNGLFRSKLPVRTLEMPHVAGTEVTIHAPFTGDPTLFTYQPNVIFMLLAHADVVGHEVRLVYHVTDHDTAALKAQVDNDLALVTSNLDALRTDVEDFNGSLKDRARKRIDARRERLLKDNILVASLGFPLKRRSDAPPTFVAPVTRRPSPVVRPKVEGGPRPNEWTLSSDEYENILSIISSMVHVIERSPDAFRNIKEEDLRTHFLVQLNGQYEGQATGETFNFSGKTDILIHAEGKNIFIAECKFWDGQKSLADAIDQLLGYTCWRDTKTAILLFNRNRDLTSVLKQIPDIVKGHANFRRQLPNRSATHFCFELHHRDDRERELRLAIMVFEVPS